MNMNENEAAKTVQAKSVSKEALPQILAVCVKNILLLGFGMSLGFPTILIPGVSGGDKNEDIIMGPEAISWIGSINLICVPLGCTASGIITHAIGRRRSMQIVNFPFLAAWLLFHFSTEVWHIFLASCMTGLSGGLLEAPVLTYVAEITQPHLRGILSSSSTLAVVLGVLSQFLLGTFNTWRVVGLINCSVPIASFVLLMFVPETPVWLITKNRFDEARQSLAWLRGWTTTDSIEEEYQELHKQIKVTQEHRSSKNFEWIRQFRSRSFLWPYGVVTAAFFLSHFNGNTPMQVYAIKLFKVLHAPISEYYSTVLMGAVQLFGCIMCVGLINTLGKRLINLVSLSGSAICFFIVGGYAHIHGIDDLELSQAAEDVHHWVPLTFLVVSSFLSYLGLKILPWILIGEVFHTEIRATASGLSAGIGYIFGFVANKIFLGMVHQLTLPVVFWIYGAVGLVGAVIMYFILPETEGKTLFEITEHFAGRGRLRNSVRRKRLRAANVLLINIRALGSEIAKNILLSGINSLTILDDGIVTEEEQKKNFLLNRDSIGKKIAEEVLLKAQALNPLVKIVADTDSPSSKEQSFYKNFTIIVATCLKSDLLLKIDKTCRANNVQLIFGDVFGTFGYSVADFLEHEYHEDQVQLSGKKRNHEGVEKNTVKVQGTISYPELNKVLILPNRKQSADSIKKSKRRNELFFLMLALIEFRNKHDRNPLKAFKKEDLEALQAIKKDIFELYQVDESKSKLSEDIFAIVFGEVVPVCAVLGGIISQEVIKAVSHKEVPINNVFLFDPVTYDGKEETVGA